MKSVDEMIELNRTQAKFYDSIQRAEDETKQNGHVGNKSANFVTRFWASMRVRQQKAVKLAGVEAEMKAAHARWIASRKGGSFLELGCASGSPSTYQMAELSAKYLGVDLSPLLAKSLNQRLADRGLGHKATAQSLDILTMSEDTKFDVIYAHGVLHHFENPGPLFRKLAALCKPGGLLLFVDPCAINPVYRVLRSMYRPFQADAAWEWPFRQSTVDALERCFERVDGFGWGRRSLLLSVFTGLPILGGLLLKTYVRWTQQEVAEGWHPKVWNNSMVTALYRVRKTLP